MAAAAPAGPGRRSPAWLKALVALALLVLAAALLLAFFPWDRLRGPVGRYVTEKTGREFAITQSLDVKLGRTARVIMEGVEFANPPWAQDPHLIKAQAAEIHVELLPLLLRRQIVLPLVKLTQPELGLQMEEDGRRTWALGGDTKDERHVPDIGAFVADRGRAHFVASHLGADLRAEFAIDDPAAPAGPQGAQGAQAAGPPMPMRFRAQGRWQQEPFEAQGRTGDVLVLSAPLQNPFPLDVQASAGRTQLQLRGTVASLASFDGANVDVRLQGPNLAQLHRIVGVTLPETPPYAVSGQLSKQGAAWQARQLSGRLGNTDIRGEVTFDRSGTVPLLTGQLRSPVLDFEDLAPLIGLDQDPPEPRRTAARQDPDRKVLPDAPLDVSRLRTMNADVRFAADRITNAKRLPLDSADVHVLLKAGVLTLQPLELGMAGGRVAGLLRIDANSRPVVAQVKLDARSMELSRLFPGTEVRKTSFGKVHGELDLTGRGDSTARMLATASGDLSLLMGKGQISNLLLELAGLDGGEAVKFLLGGDTRVPLRCGALAFGIDSGVMNARVFVLDTADTVFHGDGRLNLATEAIDLVVRPYPKDPSILSLRSPLKVGGTLGSLDAGLDKGALAGRAGLAIALGAINPLLALAATIETGPGENADCQAALREAAAPGAAARGGQPAAPAAARAQREGQVMGGAPGERAPGAAAAKERSERPNRATTPSGADAVGPRANGP